MPAAWAAGVAASPVVRRAEVVRAMVARRTCLSTVFPFPLHAQEGSTSPLRSATAWCQVSPKQVFRLVAQVVPRATYGCGSAPDLDRLPLACEVRLVAADWRRLNLALVAAA